MDTHTYTHTHTHTHITLTTLHVVSVPRPVPIAVNRECNSHTVPILTSRDGLLFVSKMADSCSDTKVVVSLTARERLT